MRAVYGDGDGGSCSFDGTDDEDDHDNDEVQHDVKDDPIVDSRSRLEQHNIMMSSITGSMHNCEQGQPKPQLGAVQSPPTAKPQGRGGDGMRRAPPQAPPYRAGGDTMGEGGCGSPASCMAITPLRPRVSYHADIK